MLQNGLEELSLHRVPIQAKAPSSSVSEHWDPALPEYTR